MSKENPQHDLSPEQWSALIRKLTVEAERSMWWVRKGDANTEETVMSALRTYLRQAKQGDLPPPVDDESLWPVLAKQLDRKVGAARATQKYKKNRSTVRFSELVPMEDGAPAEDGFACATPGPEQVEAYVSEAFRLLAESITDEELLTIARMKLERYATKEIAEATGLSEHQVRRRLSRIRAELEKDGGADG